MRYLINEVASNVDFNDFVGIYLFNIKIFFFILKLYDRAMIYFTLTISALNATLNK